MIYLGRRGTSVWIKPKLQILIQFTFFNPPHPCKKVILQTSAGFAVAKARQGDLSSTLASALAPSSLSTKTASSSGSGILNHSHQI